MSFKYSGFGLLNFDEKKVLISKLENLIKEINTKSGISLECFLSTYDVWPWNQFGDIIVEDAQRGVAISLIFAFIVLLLTTQNIWVSLLSTFSISSIILQMMAMIKFNDWHFGIIQSICVIVFIGISVDYVAHIAHQFVHSTHQLRRNRTNEAYRQMGQTILGGALTSIFAGVFLVFCNVAILNQFGILFITTIVASFFSAIVFFPSILFIFGPDNKQGDLKEWVNIIKKKFNKEKIQSS